MPNPRNNDGPEAGIPFEVLAKRVFAKALQLRSEERSLDDPGLKKDVWELCDAAGREALPAEALIVQLKRAWSGVSSTADPYDRNALVAELVSLCIKEFYRA